MNPRELNESIYVQEVILKVNITYSKSNIILTMVLTFIGISYNSTIVISL
jgi:hypothetical protein